ncbi:hypothetical protein [Clostridium perfringens]|uniref:hypothetical protein n=1 Tax=Clostridium perfringens TaxID=1502 RepID=UPI001E5C8192|nr:hypothetical protein [Clostridium perfringens]WVL78284.1 hypothetical protein LMS42_015080 [Clostridium perfringens]
MKKNFEISELEHGKIYKSGGSCKLYRLYQGKLQWRNRSGEWVDSCKTYNELVDEKFTLLKEGHTFKEAILSLEEGATIESFSGWKYRIDLGLFKILKTKDGFENTGIFDLDDSIFSYDEITNIWFIERC